MSYRIERKTVIINGADCSRFFTATGYTVEYEITSGGNEGYLQNGEYLEDEISRKAVVTFPVMPLNHADHAELLHILYDSDRNTLIYFDPYTNDYRTVSTLRGSLSAAKYRGRGADGREYWTTGTLTLKEK